MREPEVKVNNNNHGIGFTGLLTIVFITLKLLGYITWSWWWVFSPLWIGALVGISIFAISFAIILWAQK